MAGSVLMPPVYRWAHARRQPTVVNMARRSDQPASPRPSEPDLPPRLTEVNAFEAGETFGARVTGLEGDVDAANTSILETIVAEPNLQAWNLAGTTMTDVRIESARAASVTAREGRWRNVLLAGGRIGTLDLSRAQLDGVVFEGVRIEYLSMAGAQVANVTLRDCTVTTWDVPDAKLTRVLVENTSADELDTRGVELVDVDLRGLSAASFTEPRHLRGATLSASQSAIHAVEFARALGIRIG